MRHTGAPCSFEQAPTKSVVHRGSQKYTAYIPNQYEIITHSPQKFCLVSHLEGILVQICLLSPIMQTNHFYWFPLDCLS